MNIDDVIRLLRGLQKNEAMLGPSNQFQHAADTLENYRDKYALSFTPQHISLFALKHLDAEIGRARGYFPHKIGPDGTPINRNFKALVEEVGELANALMDHTLWADTGKVSKKYGAIVFPLEVFSEAIQCATMAIRIAEEGDHGEAYQYKMLRMSQGEYIATYGKQKPRETYDDKTPPLSDHPDLQMSADDRQRTGPNGRP